MLQRTSEDMGADRQAEIGREKDPGLNVRVVVLSFRGLDRNLGDCRGAS